MSPPPRQLSDSQKEIAAIVAEAAETGAAKGAVSKTPSPSDSSERMFEIAETVHQRNKAARWLECEQDGPTKKLAVKIDDHEDRISIMEKARERDAGAQQWRGRLVAAVGVLGVLSGIAATWYGVTHKAHAATSDVAAELQALRVEIRRATATPEPSR